MVRAYDWGPQRALTLQSDLVNRLAELRHPNLLPLLGVCAESRLFVYGLMPVRNPHNLPFLTNLLLAFSKLLV